jgi:ABC-type glycerol-3-phosphate transport system substrate-binding protein
MSGTVHGNRPAGRAGILAASGVVLLLAGCGGTEPASDATTGTPAATTSAAGASSGDFCAQAADLDERVDVAVSELDEGPSISEAFRRLTAELRAVEPPAAIADDWATMADGLDRMADAIADVDLADPSTLGALDDAEGDLSAAADRVDAHLRTECGIN